LTNGLREDCFLIGQSQRRTTYGRHISCTTGTKYLHFVQDLPYIIPTKLCFLVSDEKI